MSAMSTDDIVIVGVVLLVVPPFMLLASFAKYVDELMTFAGAVVFVVGLLLVLSKTEKSELVAGQNE